MNLSHKIEKLGRMMMAIKYFHPSDASALANWDALMSAAFKNLLETQDLIQTYQTMVAPLVREHLGQSDELVYWQHIGVDTKHSFWEGRMQVYRSWRTLRDELTDLPIHFIQQSVARNFKGSRIDLKWSSHGEAKPYILGLNLQGKICFLHTPKDSSFSFDVIEDTYEISFGFWLIEPSCSPRLMEVLLDGKNNLGQDPDFSGYFQKTSFAWKLNSAIYKNDAASRSIDLIAPMINNQIVPAKPGSLEKMSFDLGVDGPVDISLVLTHEEAMEAFADRETRQQIEEKGKEVLAEKGTAVRLADVMLTWSTLAYFHPYIQIEKISFLSLDQLINDVLEDSSGNRLDNILGHLLSHINDGHVFFKSLRPNLFPPFNILPVEGGYAIAAADPQFAHHLGDMITHIDGAPIMEVIAERSKEVSGSNGRRNEMAGWMATSGAEGSICQLQFEQGSKIEAIRNNRFPPKIPHLHPPCFNPTMDTLYLDVSRLSYEELLETLKETAASKIIFDNRGYPLGNHDILRHFIQETIQDPWLQFPYYVRPRSDKLCDGYVDASWAMTPATPFFQKKVVVLIHHRSQSYAETWTGFAKKIFPGGLIGKNTSGANGNIQFMTLPSGTSISWTQGHVRDLSGEVYFATGIKPDFEVKLTAEDFKYQKDPYIEKALEVLGLI